MGDPAELTRTERVGAMNFAAAIITSVVDDEALPIEVVVLTDDDETKIVQLAQSHQDLRTALIATLLIANMTLEGSVPLTDVREAITLGREALGLEPTKET